MNDPHKITVHVLPCSSEEANILNAVKMSDKYASQYIEPIPWQDFKCKSNKVAFIATRPNISDLEIVGWAICYTHPIFKYVYISSISTIRGPDGRGKYAQTGSRIMNKIIETFRQKYDFIMLLPINGSEPFYQKFGFVKYSSTLMYLGLKKILNEETHIVKWNDAQLTVVPEMLYEFEGTVPKTTFANLKHFLTHYQQSMKPGRADRWQEIISEFEDGTLDRSRLIRLTPKRLSVKGGAGRLT